MYIQSVHLEKQMQDVNSLYAIEIKGKYILILYGKINLIYFNTYS